MTRRWRRLCRGDNVLGALARSPAPPRPRRPLSRSPSSQPLRYEGASPGLAEAGAGSLCLRGSVKREARAGSGAARGARGPARVPGERGLRAPRTRRGRLAPAGLGRRLNSVRGPPFPLRGILGHDSRSPSLSCFSSLPLSGASPLWAARSARVGAANSRSRWQGSEPSAQGRSRCGGAGEPDKAASRALEARSPAAAGAEGGPRGAELSTAALPLPCFLRYPAEVGGAGHPLRSGGARRRGRLGLPAPATFSH